MYNDYNRELHHFVENNLERFVKLNIPYDEGVYFIEDFYIGRTKNIRNRITSHIIEAFLNKNNKRKNKRINDIIKNGGKIKVKMLSNNQEDEEKLIIKNCYKYNLTNIEFNPNIQIEELYDGIKDLDNLLELGNFLSENFLEFQQKKDYGYLLLTCENKFCTLKYGILNTYFTSRVNRMIKVFGAENVKFKFINEDISELDGYELIKTHSEEKEIEKEIKSIGIKEKVNNYIKDYTEDKLTIKIISQNTGITLEHLKKYYRGLSSVLKERKKKIKIN